MSVEIPIAKIDEFIGYQTQPTPWFSIDQQRINAFADVTLDHQFIHVNPERAAASPFGTTIAHGFLSLSLLPFFIEQLQFYLEGMTMGLNYGFDKVRFLHPVAVDSEIRAYGCITGIVEKQSKHYLIAMDVTIEIKGQQKPALVAEWLGMQIIN